MEDAVTTHSTRYEIWILLCVCFVMVVGVPKRNWGQQSTQSGTVKGSLMEGLIVKLEVETDFKV